MPLTLEQLNAATQAEFTALLDGTYEHSPWIAEAAWAKRPFASLAAMKLALVQALRDAGLDAQLALIRAHPELAGKAAMRMELTEASQTEQAGAGLDQCSPGEFETLTRLNAEYTRRFGMPFILAVRGHTRGSIIENLQRRLQGDAAGEFAEALRQIERIALLRLKDRIAEPQ